MSHRQGTFEVEVLREVSDSEGEKVAREWRKLLNERLGSL
jgi:hypothetical protein